VGSGKLREGARLIICTNRLEDIEKGPPGQFQNQRQVEGQIKQYARVDQRTPQRAVSKSYGGNTKEKVCH
jgi:hypothetical protein